MWSLEQWPRHNLLSQLQQRQGINQNKSVKLNSWRNHHSYMFYFVQINPNSSFTAKGSQTLNSINHDAWVGKGPQASVSGWKRLRKLKVRHWHQGLPSSSPHFPDEAGLFHKVQWVSKSSSPTGRLFRLPLTDTRAHLPCGDGVCTPELARIC